MAEDAADRLHRCNRWSKGACCRGSTGLTAAGIGARTAACVGGTAGLASN